MYFNRKYKLFKNYFLLKETIYYSISKIVPGLLGLASVLFFIRIFGSGEYGKYSLILSQCNLIVAIVFGWLNQSQLRYFSVDNNNSDYKRSQSRSLFFSITASLIILSLLILVQSFSIQIWIISLTAIISIGLFNYLKTIYQVKLFPLKVMYMTAAQSLLGFIFPILLLLLGWKGENTILLGVALSFFIVVVFIKLFVYNKSFIDKSTKKEGKNNNILINKWFSYGGPISIWFAAGLTLPFLDRFFINQYLSSYELGIYSSLQELLTRVYSLILFPIILTLHPRIMNLWNSSNFNEAKKLIKNGINIFLFMGLLILCIVWKFDDIIFLVLQKALPELKNHNQQLVIPLLSAGFLWQLSFLTHKMLELKEKTVIMLIAIFPSLIVNIIANNLFLPKFGVLATANAAFISALTYCVTTFFYSVYSMNKVKKYK